MACLRNVKCIIVSCTYVFILRAEVCAKNKDVCTIQYWVMRLVQVCVCRCTVMANLLSREMGIAVSSETLQGIAERSRLNREQMPGTEVMVLNRGSEVRTMVSQITEPVYGERQRRQETGAEVHTPQRGSVSADRSGIPGGFDPTDDSSPSTRTAMASLMADSEGPEEDASAEAPADHEDDASPAQERPRAEDEARLEAEDEARVKAMEEATRWLAGELGPRNAENQESAAGQERPRADDEEASLEAEEGQRLQAEEAQRLRAEEDARLEAEEGQRLQAEEEAHLAAEKAQRLRTEEEARLAAEEARRLRAEEEGLRDAGEQARRQQAKKMRALFTVDHPEDHQELREKATVGSNRTPSPRRKAASKAIRELTKMSTPSPRSTAASKAMVELKQMTSVAKRTPSPRRKGAPKTIGYYSPSPTKFFVCNHEDPTTFKRQDATSFYCESYLSKNDRAPKQCHGCNCGARFGVNYKVGINNPVMVCENALRKRHQCGFAYCKSCFVNWLNNNANDDDGRRSKRRRKVAKNIDSP